MFNFIKLQKTYDRIFSITLIILSFVAIGSFISILITSKSIKYFAFDCTENGWIHLFNTFKFPLSTLALILPIYTLWIAISRFYQYDESIKLNRRAFELSEKAFSTDYRPFVTNKFFNYVNRINNISMRCFNFGKIPAKINNIHIEFKEQDKIVFSKEYNENLRILFPNEDSSDEIRYVEKIKFAVHPDNWIENKSDIKANIIINYQGLENTSYSTIEIWFFDLAIGEFSRLESKWF